MIERLKSRYFVFGLLVIAMFIFMGAGLYTLTIVRGDENKELSERTSIKSITLQGERGRILDRNGLPLAYNQKSYDIQFYRDPERRNYKSNAADYARYTRILMEAIRIIEQGGGKTISTFSIVRGADMRFRFEWGDISPEAQARREANWRKNMYTDTASTKRTPEQIYRYLRRRYQIPEELNYEEAHKLLSIWQEVSLNEWVAYMPTKIASNVSIETVAELELKSLDLEGISVTEGNIRIYPQGSLAAHAIGYLGRITSEDDLRNYEAKGYNRENLVGKTGIEYTLEEALTGNTQAQAGKEVVEVNSQHKVTRTIERRAPSDGHDVMLTIDMYLQKVVEAALEKNILEINALQQEQLLKNPDSYTKMNLKPQDVKLAEYGAAVVMDVKNGEVLAMASYPTFDLNVFTGGITPEAFETLMNSDTAKRTTPLYNKAIRTKTAPGSIFKMATGLAALEEGAVKINETINDESPYTGYIEGFRKGIDKTPTDAPNCWTTRTSDHVNLTVESALRVSCNYFFSEVAHRMGIDALNKWAGKLGLDSLTGIELDGETRGQIGGQAVLYDKNVSLNEQRISRPTLVANGVREKLRAFCNSLDLEADPEAIEACTLELLKLVDPNNTEVGEAIRTAMSSHLAIPKAVSQAEGWSLQINQLLRQLRWTPAETVRTGFGQSIMLVTPIAAARYLSSLVNGGYVYDAHIVRKIVDTDGRTVKSTEPKVFQELNADPANMEQIILGMREAVSPEDRSATAGAAFKGWGYANEIGGKTGTAQTGASKAANIDLENTSWFAAYCPREDPEIAIIIYIPHGWQGALSSTAVKDIVQFYMDRKTKQAPENIPGANTLVMG